MVNLDRDIRMIALQFSFSNPNIIPPSVKCLGQETQDEMLDRRSRSSGVLVIKPTEKCSLADFVRELEASGYEMVDAFYKKRIDAKDFSGRKRYHMVRFLFARHEFVELSDDFKKMRDTVRTEIWSICKDAIWRVRLFFNQFYKNGEEIKGQYALSINLEARQPLFCPGGQPVKIWQKDNNGKRMGEAPLPLKADYDLRVDKNILSLMVV